ncbi:hypothetical protein ACFOY5_10815 [Massilia aurea]|uniref:hypothetical protein n=1 Tax=Massilia aurea TaxID=373040 RepID=UPI0021627FAD|nr:hypothetical protein [Massilia aurea]MCS0709451.1 hypothetical protein [Massilia aurea]
MANGIDWFRWHHGSVNDPKFGLVARKAAARVGDVIAVWALILEQASANTERGLFGAIDCEATDFLLGADDGTTARILEAMQGRALVDGERVTRWEERQPKRERVDTTAAERKRQQRERDSANTGADAGVTSGHAMSRQVTPREEERREEKNNDDSASAAAGADVVVVDPDPAEPDSPRAAAMPPREDLPESTDPAVVLSVALRKLGVNATFTHPTVQDWSTRKVPMAVLHAAVATAREQKGPDAKIPPNYLVRIVEDLLNPPPAAQGYGKPPAAPIQIRKPQGNEPKGTDESYDEWQARVDAHEAARRKALNP